MEALKFVDSHNMVAYLDKSTENADFDEIVDFLNANPIRYALTVSPTIYVSYIEQFWSTTKTKTINNETQICAKVDGMTIVIIESSVRKDLHFNDEDAVFNDEYDTPSHTKKVFANMRKQGKDFSGTVTPLFATMLIQSQAVEGEVNIHGSGEDSMKLNELMKICTNLSERVLALENIKAAQVLEITNLKKRVKKLEKKIKSRTPQLKRRLFKVRIESSAEKSLGDQEDASKQGRNEIDQDEGISWFQEDVETQGRYGHDTKINTISTSITTASINITTAEPVITASAPVATADVSFSTAEPKKSKEKGVSSETATRLTRGVIMKEASETATRPIVPPQQQLDLKDKGKRIMQEPEKPVKMKDETVYEESGDSMERAAATAISLDAEQGSGNIIRTQSMATLNELIPQETGSGSGPRRQDTMFGDRPAQTWFERLSKQSNDPPLLRFNTFGSGEDSMKLKELIDIYIKLSERVLALENIKITQDLKFTNLKKRVKKLEKKKKSRTPQLKRRLFKVRIESSAEKSLGDQEDASKQGRNEINQDEGISWFQEDAMTQGSTPVATAGVSISTAEPSTPPTTTTTFIEDEDLTITQTLMKMRKASETATRPIVPPQQRPIVPPQQRPIVPPQQQLDPKDKGKGIMQEPKKPVKVKGKDQIKYDANMAKRLQAELDEEVRIERKREEEPSNTALIEE
ncbi:hypothetical protein Tco_0822620 [Tanacetum coccineum]|uniref:Xylulose kinase-1 n=1 Tax=Tanacetum coccineum TaxID=301880 RepID=A0ABQ5AGL8_9ASTR